MSEEKKNQIVYNKDEQSIVPIYGLLCHQLLWKVYRLLLNKKNTVIQDYSALCEKLCTSTIQDKLVS
jgi:hypothetical protein